MDWLLGMDVDEQRSVRWGVSKGGSVSGWSAKELSWKNIGAAFSNRVIKAQVRDLLSLELSTYSIDYALGLLFRARDLPSLELSTYSLDYALGLLSRARDCSLDLVTYSLDYSLGLISRASD
jgi:hypothetical protein